MSECIKLMKRMRLLIIVSGVLLFLLIWKLSLDILATNNYYIFLMGINCYTNQAILNFLIVALGCVGLVLWFDKTWSRVVIIISCLVILFFVVCFGIFQAEKKYFYFVSPDKQNTLIIEECSGFLEGWSNCYIQINHCLYREVDSNISTNNGYRPFSEGDYQIKWGESSALISYGFGNIDVIKDTVISLN